MFGSKPTERTDMTVSELVALYWETESQEVAAGILHGLHDAVRRSGQEVWAAAVRQQVDFLFEVGQEGGREPEHRLRDLARRLLVRNSLPLLDRAEIDSKVVVRFIHFFSVESHCYPLEDRDRERLIRWVDQVGGHIFSARRLQLSSDDLEAYDRLLVSSRRFCFSDQKEDWRFNVAPCVMTHVYERLVILSGGRRNLSLTWMWSKLPRFETRGDYYYPAWPELDNEEQYIVDRGVLLNACVAANSYSGFTGFILRWLNVIDLRFAEMKKSSAAK